MKNSFHFLPVLLCVALIVAGGCGKKDETAAGSSPAAKPSTGGTVEKAVATAQAQTEVVKQKAQEVITNVQAQASASAGQAQALIDQTKKLLGENKWSEALTLLSKLSGQPLSADQQSAVQSLKDQAQKAAESAVATKAVGGLLPK